MPNLPFPILTIGRLALSNVFTAFAWYSHLTFKAALLFAVALIAWGIVVFGCVLQVPGDRIGHGYFTAAGLNPTQEVLTLPIFAVFSVFYPQEPLGWNHLPGFGFIALGAFFIFHKWGTT